MVARKLGAETSAKGLPARLLDRWRWLLGRWIRSTAGGGAELRDAARGDVGALRGPSVVVLGAASLLIGAIARVALSAPGPARSGALVAGIAAVLWAVARFAIVMAKVQTLARDTAAVRGAFAVGLIPFALAVSPALALVAWAASGAITWWLLVRLGERRDRAIVAVGFAWGAQAAIYVVGWLVRNALVAMSLGAG